MSRSMPAPWLKPTTLELISDVHVETGINHSNCKPKLVQVIRGNENLGTLLVHDKDSSVTAFLTQGCLEDFRRSHPHRSLVSLRGSLVKLDRWHVSTVVQCAANRPRAVGNGTITFPLCIQVSKLAAIGADDCNVFGDPSDINRDPQVLEKIRNLNYLQLAERLSERQFQASHLPDVEGQFSIPHHYSDQYQLRWHHAIIVEEEQRVLDEITEFEPVESVAAQKIREYEAEARREAVATPSRRRHTPSRVDADDENELEGTQLRFTQTDSDNDFNDEDDLPILSQSQRVMTFITQEQLSQQFDAAATQDSASASQADETPVQLSQTRRGQNRRSSIGLAASQPLSPMTLDLFASIQEGTEWYTQPLTQSLLSTLEEAWGSQDTSRPLTPVSTRRPATPGGIAAQTTPLYGARVVPSSARTPGITERPVLAIKRPATQPARHRATTPSDRRTQVDSIVVSSMHRHVKVTTTREKRKRLNLFNRGGDEADNEDDEDEDLTEFETEDDSRPRANRRRRLSSKLLRSNRTQDGAPPLFGLVQDALDRLLGDEEPTLLGRDTFGNLVLHRHRP